MKIWIIQTAEPMHIDVGDVRPMRAMNLADALIEAGHEVSIWTSAFMHSTKTHRSRKFLSKKINNKLTINLIPSFGYKNNIGLRRIADHLNLAFNLKKEIKRTITDNPDVVFIGYPPIEIAFVAVTFFQKRKIPTVVDVKDLWPTLFLEFFPKFTYPILRILLAPYYFFAKLTFKRATALSAMSKEYINWIYKFSDIKEKKLELITPLTNKKRINILPELEKAEKWWKKYDVNQKNIRRFCFVGYFNSMYDFDILKYLALRFLKENIDCQFVLCGTGGMAYEKVKKLLSGLNNVIFPGWIDPPKIEYLSKCCSGYIMPYRNIENFKLNITNKVADSLAYGIPIITTLEGALKKLLEDHKVGYSIPMEQKEKFYKYANLLLDDDNLRRRLSSNAIDLYRTQFESTKVYSNLVYSLEKLSSS